LTSRLAGEKSRLALVLVADQSIFLSPPADELPADAAPSSASVQQMLLKVVTYLNATVRQLPNLMATRFSNGFEDPPREDKMGRTGSREHFLFAPPLGRKLQGRGDLSRPEGDGRQDRENGEDKETASEV
jgi:hypothetical protein